MLYLKLQYDWLYNQNIGQFVGFIYSLFVYPRLFCKWKLERVFISRRILRSFEPDSQTRIKSDIHAVNNFDPWIIHLGHQRVAFMDS